MSGKRVMLVVWSLGSVTVADLPVFEYRPRSSLLPHRISFPRPRKSAGLTYAWVSSRVFFVVVGFCVFCLEQFADMIIME